MARAHGQRAAGRAAFTIAELMMVIMIMSLMAYSVGLSFDALVPGERLNASVRALAGVLQGCRSEAISRNAEFLIEYDLDNERYRQISPYRLGGGVMVTEDEEFDQRQRSGWMALETGVEFASVTVAGELYTGGTVLVRFDPLGAASDHDIVLTQPQFESSFTIEVLALTGLIRFHDGVYRRDPPDDGDFR